MSTGFVFPRAVRSHHGIIACTLLSAILVIGCGGAKVVHVEQDQSFTYAAATGEGLGILGVTSVVGSDDERAAVRRGLPALFARSLHKKRDDLKIADPIVLRDALGTDAHKVLLDSYETNGDLNSVGIATLTAGAGELVRYAILARVEDNWVDQSTNDFSSAEVDPHTDYITSRHVATKFTIYDLETGVTAWTGRIEHSEINKRTETHEKTSTTSNQSFTEACAEGCMTSLIQSIFGGGGDPYPEPPSLSEVLDDVFVEFADNLPKEEE